jgi:CRP/FNR family transcriptional regulator, cyclic AMP receptor protein
MGGLMADKTPDFLGLFSRWDDLIELKAGDILFKKGDPAKHMYVVISGSLRVGEGNAVLEEVAPGGIVGEMAIIEDVPRSATVTAAADCTLARVDERRFLFLIQETPGFALNVMRLLSHRLRRMNQLVKA